MKSNPSCFNATVFKKNLTRFAPAWGLYTIGLLMALVSIIDGGSRWFASNLCDSVQILCVITPCYALLCAQLLFGDLYNTRMCNALHALPLKRDTWFVTNVVSGFALHLIPTLVFSIFATIYGLLSEFNAAWQAAPVWLLGVNLQFACFFGIAVFSAFCVGNRFAQAVVYCILNFGSLILGWLVNTIFVPMYYGVKINITPFFWFSPIGQMTQDPFCAHTATYRYDQWDQGALVPEANFGYYFLVAAVGIALLVFALGLYRRRKLECAGDFLAFRKLEPVFLVVYTLIVGTMFHFVSDEIFGFDIYLYLFVGLAVGWFTGKMLLERTPRVFRLKNILRCGILMAACALTLLAAALDPFGIESWIPEAEEVESVTIADGHYNYHTCELTLDDPADIQKIIDIHRERLESFDNYGAYEIIHVETTTGSSEYPDESTSRMDYSMAFTFTYRLKNGRTVNRYYHIWMGGENGIYINQLFTTPNAVLGCEDADTFLAENSNLQIRDTWEGRETFVITQTDIRNLFEAILADCEAGTMAQNYNFHNADAPLYWISAGNDLEITVFSSCENTLNWLRAYGLDVEDIMEEYEK